MSLFSIVVTLLLFSRTFKCLAVADVELLWDHKGTTGWLFFSSPAYAETNSGRGVLVSSTIGCIFFIDVETGEVFKEHCDGIQRAGGGIAMAKNFKEVDDTVFCVGYNKDPGKQPSVLCYDENGEQVMSAQVSSLVKEDGFYSLSLGKLEKDGPWRVVTGVPCTPCTEENTQVLDTNGQVLERLPKPGSGEVAHGIISRNHALVDLNGDGNLEILAPSDNYAICVWDKDYNSFPVNEIFSSDTWGNVQFSETYDGCEHPGSPWHRCPDDDKPYFAKGIVTAFKVDGNLILAVTGQLTLKGDSVTDVGKILYLLNPDRTRYKNESLGFDWETVPVTGTSIGTSSGYIGSTVHAISIADLNGDEFPEIIFPCNDGYIHAYSLDKEEKNAWPYRVGTSSNRKFASEVVVIQNPGEHPIVISAIRAETDVEGFFGELHFINYDGNLLFKVDLPQPSSTSRTTSYVLGSPTVFRHEGRTGNLLLNIQTSFAGNVLYELKGTEEAAILWATSKGNYRRDGTASYGTFRANYHDPGGNVVPPVFDGPGTNAAGVALGLIFGLGIPMLIVVAAVIAVIVVFVVIKKKKEYENQGGKI